MKKKVAIVIVLSCIFTSSLIFGCEDNKAETNDFETMVQTLQQYQIIDSDIELNQKVTRGKCIEAIMRLIGGDIEANNYFTEASPSLMKYIDSYDNENRDEHWGYIYYSFWMNISYGEDKKDEVTDRIEYYFYPKRIVTLKEATAFVVRSLEKYPDRQGLWYNDETEQIPSLEKTFTKGRQIGIIKTNDSFYTAYGSKTLTYHDLIILLNRMLEQPRYWYIQKEYVYMDEEKPELGGGVVWSYKEDIERTLTYREYLDEKIAG
jgi:hypothetical protein